MNKRLLGRLMFVSLGIAVVHTECAAAPADLERAFQPPFDLPKPTWKSPWHVPPELVVTQIECKARTVGSNQNNQKLAVVATIANGFGDAGPFFTQIDVLYTQRPTPANPTPTPQTSTALALTSPFNTNPSLPGGRLPGLGQTVEVEIGFYSGHNNPSGSQPNIDPQDGPFTVTVTANSGDANHNGVIAEYNTQNNVRNCMCRFDDALKC